jgi:hypothetical protein
VTDLLLHLLRASPASAAADSVADWWARWSRATPRFSRPIDAAIAGGLAADRLGFAFAAGYHAALRALLPGVPHDRRVALSATEEGGAHPRAIRTTLVAEGEDFVLSGKKRWTTLATEADELLVFASLGADAAGKQRLRVARVRATAPGVSITPMPATPFAPEIPHAEVLLERVSVSGDDLLPGDGWETWVKPFRTVEDLHMHGALLGYLIGVARRFDFPRTDSERLLSLVVATRALADAPAARPELEVALAGLLGETARAVVELEPRWEAVSAAERERWRRDRPLLEVAGSARRARTERAWERLSGVEIERGGS